MSHKGKIILLSGPSCMGKGSLLKSLKKFHPGLRKKLERVVMFNSRSPRPGETDGVEFRFRPRTYIEELIKKKDLLALEVRGDLHALNVRKIEKIVKKSDALIIDHPYMIRELRHHPKLPQVPTLSIMLSPFSREEILFFKSRKDLVFSFADMVADYMRRKLLRRMRRQKNILSMKDLEEAETRSKNAYLELKEAHHFDHVLVNHDGGDAENWTSFYYPVGDAMRTLRGFSSLLAEGKSEFAEKWESDLVP